MNYEKAYKEALERAREELGSGCFDRGTVEYIFPELKESEDEKISSEITEFILTHRIDEPNDIEDTNSWLAWLEKQGEQKEYTFKSLPRLLEMIEPTERAKAYCQKLIDAFIKEGYATDAKIVGECLKQMNGERVALATMDSQEVNKSEDEIIRKAQLDYWYSVGGKEWHGVPVQEVIAWLEKQAEQKTIKWTEKDESKVEDIVYFLDTAKTHYASTEAIDDCVAWLESLRLRKQLSKEDKEMFDCALDMIEWYSGKNENKVRLVSNWLKSLKQRML